MPLLHAINPEAVAAALRAHAGISIAPESIQLERRSWRWFATLPDDRILFVTDRPAETARLAREGRLLTALAPRVSFALPKVQNIDPAFGLQVRSLVPGAQLAGAGREQDFAGRPQAARLAEDLGRALAEIHTAFTAAETRALDCVETEPLLPPPDALAARMGNRLTDPHIARTFAVLIERYRGVKPAPADVGLVHGDIWGGNLAVDLETGALNGLFDFADAGIADRHLDLMYIHSFGPAFAERLFDTYTARTGFAISRQRTALYHAIAAFSALAETVDEGNDRLLEQRHRWVAAVCNGPVARMAIA